MLSTQKKADILKRWQLTGKFQHVMLHEELVDYNLNLPIRISPVKTQPYVWRSLEDPSIPRHNLAMHIQKDEHKWKRVYERKVKPPGRNYVPLIYKYRWDHEKEKVTRRPEYVESQVLVDNDLERTKLYIEKKEQIGVRRAKLEK